MTVQLPGIIDIVPDAVESARNADCRRQKGVSHPDCKDSVFLSKCLRGRNLAAVAATYGTTGSELENAGQKRGEGCLEYDCKTVAAMHYLSGTHSDCECKRYSPDIKCEIAFAHEPGVQARQEKANRHRGYER